MIRTLFIILGVILFGAAIWYFASKSPVVQTVVDTGQKALSTAATAAIVAA